MSCCGNHQNHNRDQEGAQGNNRKNRNWMMILCCIVPIVLIAVLLLTGKAWGSAGNGLLFLLVLICPLSHMLIMPLMMRRAKKETVNRS